MAFSSYLGFALAAFKSAVRDGQMTGTIEVMTVSRTSLLTIMVCSSAYNFMWTTITMVSCLIAGKLLFGVQFGNANLLAALIVFCLMMIPLCCLGLVSAAFTILFERNDPFTWFVSITSTALAGIVYPVGILPDWLSAFARLLPMTIGLDGLRRALLQGASVQTLLPQMLGLIAWALVLAPIAGYTLRYSLVIAKRYRIMAHY